MSQEKVAKYKKEKANRKEMLKKQKRARILRNCIAGVVFAAVIGWVGYSGVAFYIENLPRPEAEVNYTAISDYVDKMNQEDTDDEDTDGASQGEDADDTSDEENAG